MNDERLEDRLRQGLQRGAARVAIEPPEAISSIAGGAHAVRARRRRQRLAVTSLATVAAVGAGLIVISRDPGQPVRTDRERTGAASAGGGFATAGAATGSTTGSASGAPRGWTTTFDDEATGDSPAPLFGLAPGDDYQLVTRMTSSATRGNGQAPADLAVVADLTPGKPLRFVVASVQSADRLSAGRGGTETTIAGRPARIISRRAATVLTFDVSASTRALVYVAGVDDATVERLLASLERRDDSWVFTDSVGGGLSPVVTKTPTAQFNRVQVWQAASEAASVDDQDCAPQQWSLSVTSGGAYEFWARTAEMASWNYWSVRSDMQPTIEPMQVATIAVPGFGEVPAVVNSDNVEVTALAGDAVFVLSGWHHRTFDDAARVPIVALTAEEWAAPPIGMEPLGCAQAPGGPAAGEPAAGEPAPSTSIGDPASEPTLADTTTTSLAGANG